MRGRVQVRDGFAVLLAALWCMDQTGVLPLFLLAAAVHEAGHLLILHLSGGRLHRLVLTGCGAVLHCALPADRFACAAVCLAGPAASFALTAAAGTAGAWRLAGASALLGLFNLLPMPPLDGGMALSHLCGGRFGTARRGLALLCHLACTFSAEFSYIMLWYAFLRILSTFFLLGIRKIFGKYAL